VSGVGKLKGIGHQVPTTGNGGRDGTTGVIGVVALRVSWLSGYISPGSPI